MTARIFGFFAIVIVGLSVLLGLSGPWAGLDNLRYPLLVAAVCYLVASVVERRPWKSERLKALLAHDAFPWGLALASAAIFTRIKFLQWNAGEISGIDFSHIDYAIWSTAHGRFMQIPVIAPQATFTDFFGNHYSPVLFFHVAARWLVDSPFSSLTVHALSLAAAVPALHRLASRVVDPVTASLLALAYVFSGAVAATLQFDIHQESFYPLAFAMIFLGLYSSRAWLFAGTLLALSVKEDSGVYLFPAFLWLAYWYPQRRRECIGLAAAVVLATITTLKVLMPMHQPAAVAAPYYLPFWANYGKTFGEVVWTMLSHPHWVAWDIVSNKAIYKNLLQWGFLPVFSPMGALALPSIAVSSTALGVQRSFGLYYGIVLSPIFFFSTALVLARMRKRRIVATLAVLALSAFVGGSFLRLRHPLPYLGEVKGAAEMVSRIEGQVLVQSGLLPYLPYRSNWRRLDGVKDIPPAGSAVVALFEGLHQGSLEMNLGDLEKRLMGMGYKRISSPGRLAVFQ
jgi:uncharacterized membrane protein